MSERRVEDCPIKFGPMWLRNFSREGSAGGSGGSGAAGGANSGNGPNRNPPPSSAPNRPSQGFKHKLAQYRYGREEMLALYEDNLDPPPGLVTVEALFVPHTQRPLALSGDGVEEEPRDIRNLLGLNRNIAGGGSGPGLQPMDRFGAGRGLVDTTRGRGRLHHPFNLSNNVRPTLHRDDNHYGDAPAPGLTRSWSSGPHPTPRNGESAEWNPNRQYYKNRWPEPNWRRQNSTGGRSYGEETDGLRRLQPLGRPRQPLDKRDQKSERPTSWSYSRRPWGGEQQFSDDHLPEWATDGNTESSGGTFDSSGAFHGVDSPTQRTMTEPFYGLSRSHTQGSIPTRPRLHDDDGSITSENQQAWWNPNKTTGAMPKKFDATKIRFKKPPHTPDRVLDGETQGTQKNEVADSQYEAAVASTANLKIDDPVQDNKKKKKIVSFSDDKGGQSKTFDALMRMNIKAEEASDERGNFNSVLITPNNSLRQKHQNVMQPQSQVPATPPEQPQAKRDNAVPDHNPELVKIEQMPVHQQGVGGRGRGLNPMPEFPSFGLPVTAVEGNTMGQGVFASHPEENQFAPNEVSFQAADKQSMLKNAALKIVQESNTWYYEDPQKNVQGPFTPSEMYQWYRAGFFSPDLMIRRACDKQMRPLGSFGDLPPFAESYSELLAYLAREAMILENSGSDQLPSEAHTAADQIQQQHLHEQLQKAQLPPSLQPIQTMQQQSLLQKNSLSSRVMPAQQMSLQAPLQPTQIHSSPLQQTQMQQNTIHQAPMQQAHLHPAPMQQGQMHQAQGIPTSQLQSTQMHQSPLQQSQMMQQVSRNMPQHFNSTDILMNSSFTPSQLQDMGTQASSILGLQANFGLDSILPKNVSSTPPPVIQYGNRSNNSFLMDQMIQPQMVESLWGQSSQNFGWMQPAQVISRPEAPWEAKVPVISPELPMPESKGKQSEPPRSELQPGRPSPLLGLLSQPPPTIPQPMFTEALDINKDHGTSVASEEHENKLLDNTATKPLDNKFNKPITDVIVNRLLDTVSKPVDNIMAKPSDDNQMLQKTHEAPNSTSKNSKLTPAAPEELKESTPRKTEDLGEKMDTAISLQSGSQQPVESKSSKLTNATVTSTPAISDKSSKTKDNTVAKGKSKPSKNKDKEDTSDKKKKDAKNEIKIEEVPGYIKAKKEDKKRDSEKDKREIVIKEIPAATKASQRANLEKRKFEEAKVEEAERKRKEDSNELSDEHSKDDDDLLDKLEMKYKNVEEQTEKSRHMQVASANKKAPWCASTPSAQATNPEGLTLAEIQRLEREKKFVSIKEQQQMVQLIAQQQQAALAREQEIHQSGYNWTKLKASKKNNMDNVQTMAEIQEETRRRQLQAALEEPAPPAPSPTPAAPATHMPWSNSAGSSSSSSTYLGGFWEPTPSPILKSEEKPQSPTKNNSEAQQTKAGSKKSKVNSSPTKEAASSSKGTPSGEFDSWCVNILSPWTGKIDVPIFVSFLKDIESPYEVKDYVKCYLGETKDSTDFARNFLEKRSKLLRIAMAVPADDLCSPAPAKNPSSLSNSDYQEVKGKAKKVKKNKMLKIDARILGFSVTASEDRINVGDIDSV